MFLARIDRQPGFDAESCVDGRPEAAHCRTVTGRREGPEQPEVHGRSFVVVDTVGAGEGEVVLCVQGSSARYTPETKTLPVDAAIIGIVDQVQVAAKTIFNTNK